LHDVPSRDETASMRIDTTKGIGIINARQESIQESIDYSTAGKNRKFFAGKHLRYGKKS